MPHRKYDKILVINAGSSSLKFMLFDMATEGMLAKGLVERIGAPNANLVYQRAGAPKTEQAIAAENHGKALAMACKMLTDPDIGVLKSLTEVKAVGHRIVHGAEFFSEPVLVTEEVKASIKECCDLAPLHNPANLDGIVACETVFPQVPNVAVFDTAFHQSMPRKAYIYALPYEYYDEHKIRRYGFHGTSHRYVSAKAAEILGRPIEELKLISCHMGNGASVCAISGGRSVDTSMGFTPVAGLPMGTRSGDIDVGVLGYLMDKEGYSSSEMMDILNRKSGVLGISGVSSDFRDIEKAALSNGRAKLALEVFDYSVTKMIGAYAAAMNGVDAIIFTAGVGENSAETRASICQNLTFMGAVIDHKVNETKGTTIISAPDSKVSLLVIPTDEELIIAHDTMSIISAGKTVSLDI